MQLFRCPFCGWRPETEFHFAVETGKPRPEPAAEVSDAAWADYLYNNANPKGEAGEIWIHTTCGTFFVMRRDTLTQEVLGAEDLPREAENLPREGEDPPREGDLPREAENLPREASS